MKSHFIGFDVIYCFIPDLPLNFTMCSSILCSLSFNSTSGKFKFRWPITSHILKVISILSFFMLSGKCRFWRISQKRFRIIQQPICHYRSDYLLFCIQQSWITIDCHDEVYSKKCFQFFLGNCEVSSIQKNIKVSLFNYQFYQLAGHQRKISIGETVSFRLGCISGTRWNFYCLVT